jgi:hypothetical protein
MAPATAATSMRFTAGSGDLSLGSNRPRDLRKLDIEKLGLIIILLVCMKSFFLLFYRFVLFRKGSIEKVFFLFCGGVIF